MPIVIVEISEGLIVSDVYDETGVPIGYKLVDHSMWEGGGCAFCFGENVETVGVKYHYESRFKEIMGQPDYGYGGYVRCKDCGCDENTSVDEWIKKGGLE